jgi:hypothetical protein
LEVVVARWRKSFLVEVTQSLQQLGVKTCPVCGTEDGLAIGRRPVLVIDGALPSAASRVPMEADPDRQVTFAVRVECTTCGYLMLFNAEQHRGGDEKILVTGQVEGE